MNFKMIDNKSELFLLFRIDKIEAEPPLGPYFIFN